MKYYYTHFNGAKPYKVEIGKDIDVYDKNNIYILSIVDFKDFFIGNNIINKTKNTIGNSILVHLNNKTYIYIGENIFKFNAFDTILKYFSPIGNNDVPYPYAVGDEYTYLIIDQVYIKNELLHEADPYTQYYDNTKNVDFNKFNFKILNKYTY